VPDDDELTYIKYNMSAADIPLRMKNTVLQRRTIIRKNVFEDIKEHMPRLLDIVGMVH